nr:reverse transcriptase domain-containing protein [Tanacetum cinerariifolium]
MAALVISISLDLSVESVGSSFLRVILIGSISVEVSVAPESSLPPGSVAPMVSPFLCSDDSESDTEMSERHVSPIPHDAILTRWRSRVASRSSSPTTPCRALIMRKLVRPLPSYRLVLRAFYFGSFFIEHTPPDTTLADSSTLPRFVYPPLDRTLRDSSSESSTRPSRKRCRSPATTMTLSIHALRALVPSHVDLLPPRKRFRNSISPEDNVEEDIDTDVLANIEADAMAVEVVVDRDVEARVDAGIGMKVDVGIDVEDEVKDEVESSDRGTIEVGVDVVVGIDILDGMLMPDDVERLEQVKEVVHDIYGLIVEPVVSSRISVNQVPHYGLSIMTITHSGITPEENEELINQRVTETLADYEANRAAELVVKSQSQNGDDDDNRNVGGNGNGNDEGNGNENDRGNGNGNRGGNVNGNPNRNDRGVMLVAPECTYHDFVKCQSLNFKGTKGVVGLTRWFKKMEIVFHINNSKRGLPDNIQGNVIAAKPTRLQDAIRIANNLMDQKLKCYVLKNAKNKRRFDNNQKDNRIQQPPYKRQNVGGQSVASAYTTGSNEKKGYAGPFPYYNKSGKKTDEARGKAYMLGGTEANPDSNVIT